MSNSFIAAAEQVCLQPVFEHRQWRGQRNVVWQTIPHLCCCSRKGTTSDRWPTTGRNVELFRRGGPEPASVRHVGDTCERRRQVGWCRAMQCTIRQRRHLECSPLWHVKPVKADECVSDVVATSQVENEPCCGILDWLEKLDVSERQVNQETVAVIQPDDVMCRNEDMEDGCRYVTTNATQLTQVCEAARCCYRKLILRQNYYDSLKS